MPAELWIDACAHRLQRQWRTVDPEVLKRSPLTSGAIPDYAR